MEDINSEIKTVVGLFKGNVLTLDNGDTLSCLTYSSNKDVIEGKYIAANVRPLNEVDWLIFQYFLLSE